MENIRFFKVNNLLDMFGRADYKGLNIDLFIPGSQIYPADNSFCLIATNENVASIPADVTELTEADYASQRQAIISVIQENDPVKQLQQQNAQVLLALVNGGLM